MNKKQYEKPVMRIVEQRLTTYLQTTSMRTGTVTKNDYGDGDKSVVNEIWGDDNTLKTGYSDGGSDSWLN